MLVKVYDCTKISHEFTSENALRKGGFSKKPVSKLYKKPKNKTATPNQNLNF